MRRLQKFLTMAGKFKLVNFKIGQWKIINYNDVIK